MGGPQGPPGPAKPNLAVFSRFGGKFGWENCPTVRGTVLREPQNCFTGVPVSKKVLQCLLNHTKTPHNHYGTRPWVSLGPPGSGKTQLGRFQPFWGLNLAGRTAPPCAEPSCGDPKTALQGSLYPKKVLQCLLNHTKTPHNHYGTLPGGPHGALGPAKSKKSRIAPVSRASKKTQVDATLKGPKIALKLEFR